MRSHHLYFAEKKPRIQRTWTQTHKWCLAATAALLILFYSVEIDADAKFCVTVVYIIVHFSEISSTGDVSHLRQIPPQLDSRRDLLGPDRPLGQPGRAEEDPGAEVAVVVVSSHSSGLLHEGRRHSERAQLGQIFPFNLIEDVVCEIWKGGRFCDSYKLGRFSIVSAKHLILQNSNWINLT